MRGEVGLTPVLADKILREFARSAESPTEEMPDELTSREIEVLELVALGRTNLEIADGLGISENTVKFHMKNILQKLHARNRAEVVAYALRSGLIQLPPEE